MNTGMGKKVANAVGGRTARPCEDCRKRRARWYCAADDAFLCQACDTLVHSANPLAQRHERVRLKTASSPPSFKNKGGGEALPSWQVGFTRKARSHRPHPHARPAKPQLKAEPDSLAANLPLVPELGDDLQEENEEQLLCRVPVFDPVIGEFCASDGTTATISSDDHKPSPATDSNEMDCALDDLPCFLPSDADLAEFAADVESLLGKGFDDDSFCMEGLGLLDSRDYCEFDYSERRVKVEEKDEVEEVGASAKVEAMVDMLRDTLEFKFDYGTPATTGEEECLEKVQVRSSNGGSRSRPSKRICLRLDYEAVINAWAGQGTPWTTGDRPMINPDECWPDCLVMSGMEMGSYGEASLGSLHVGIGDSGREARVSRYREKRRTRLFAKKIRYEVRKLNAEKRPRMKGRFVKRTPSFAAPAFPY
ncbi:zinc finger protein CONSTANS-LIKE 16-like [Nymphaea colorata]|nr:zinc finger protein CONSTANS-LIKE 16-like [Nymphaea colorata]